MIADLRRKLVSVLGADEDCTDHQLIEHARHIVKVNAALWELLSRSRTPVRKPWAAVGIGEYVVERESGNLWTVTGRFPGDGEDTDIRFTMVSPSGESRDWVMRRADEVTVFEPSPLANGAELLAAELGAAYAEVGE